MTFDFEPFKEKKDGSSIPTAYLLRCVYNKKSFCEIKVENEIPVLTGRPTYDNHSDARVDGWENLTSPKAKIQKYLLDNLSTDDIIQIENNFYEPEDTEDKLFIISEE